MNQLAFLHSSKAQKRCGVEGVNVCAKDFKKLNDFMVETTGETRMLGPR